MKYYIVALFDEESYKTITPIQRNYSRKFRANRNSPMPYIALDVLDNPNIEKLTPVIEKVLKPYKKFKVELCDDVYISEASKTVNLQIVDGGYIRKIYRSLTDTLQLHGFNMKSTVDDPLSISLASLNYYNKDNKRYDANTAPNPDKTEGNGTTLKVTKFEIWKMANNKKETPLKTFELKSF